MPHLRQITVLPEGRQQLERLRDTAAKAYLRERAAAILKIADGQRPAHVARHGLLRRHAEDTVYAWVTRFERDGIAGLEITPGRGRKPAFPPQHPAAQAAREELLHVVHRDPKQFGIPQTRWRLADIHGVVDWLATMSTSGLCRLLDRMRISYKRGRDHIHSPDPDYLAKVAQLAVLLDNGRQQWPQRVVLYLDEVTYYRQPTLARAYEARGRDEPHAERSYRKNTPTRVVGALDVVTGQVCFAQGSKIGVRELVKFFRTLCDTYPKTKQLELIVDNWPVHFHADVLAALEPQHSTWPRYMRSTWPTEPSPAAVRQWGSWQLPIQLHPLPTYASWLNPIEKVWRKLKQDVLHLHRQADNLDGLRLQVKAYLEQFAGGSRALLRYVGLLVPG